MWYRVNDPLSPLSGCDVRLGPDRLDFHRRSDGALLYAIIVAVRRVDVFQGDRPYQRVSALGQDLGLMIATDRLIESPIQDDVVEIATDRPYGACVEERDHERSDGLRLRVVQYELMAQVALDDLSSGALVGSATVPLEAMEDIEEAFVEGSDSEELLARMLVGV